MPTLTLTLPKLHEAQQQIKRESTRFNVLNCGRRFGKDILLEDRLIEPALHGYPVAWFSPTYPMLTEVWRTITGILQPVIKRTDAQQHRLELITGGVVDMWSLDALNSARGRKYKKVIINEAAIVPTLQEAWEAVIRPTLADYEGSVDFGSTPNGMNYFHTLYQRGITGVDGWSAFHYPTSANPYISKEEIEAARRELPEDVFRQEYLAEFLLDGGSVFRRVDACVGTYPEWPQEPYQGTFIGGIDWGRENDYTDLTVIDPQKRRVVARDRYNRIDWSLQRERVVAMHRRWGGNISWVAEANSMGMTNIEELVQKDIPIAPFTTTQASKKQVIEGLVKAIEDGALTLPPDPILLGELKAYTQERLPSGLMRYGAPSGMHDDGVISLALAWFGSAQGTGFSVV